MNSGRNFTCGKRRYRLWSTPLSVPGVFILQTSQTFFTLGVLPSCLTRPNRTKTVGESKKSLRNFEDSPFSPPRLSVRLRCLICKNESSSLRQTSRRSVGRTESRSPPTTSSQPKIVIRPGLLLGPQTE